MVLGTYDAVDKYIENNIDLIDSSLIDFFINAYTDAINDGDFMHILNRFNSAGIEHGADRLSALHYILTKQFEDYYKDKIFLDAWIRCNLINYLGFPLEYIYNYILENKEELLPSHLELRDPMGTGKWIICYIEN